VGVALSIAIFFIALAVSPMAERGVERNMDFLRDSVVDGLGGV
jgi:hypothetical protein